MSFRHSPSQLAALHISLLGESKSAADDISDDFVELDTDKITRKEWAEKKARIKLKQRYHLIPKPTEPTFKQTLGGKETKDTIYIPVQAPKFDDGKEGIPLDDLNPPFVLTDASKATRGEQNVPHQSAHLKAFILHILSAATPLSFALNAFVAFSGKSLDTLSWDDICELGAGQQALAWLSGASSEISNYISNLENIPRAFECVSHLRENFGKNKGRNILILTLSMGAAVAAGAIGASSVAFAGTVASAANATTSTFLFFVTRFYGLVNLSKRFDKYRSQGSYEDLLTRLSKDDSALQELALQYTDEINQFVEEQKKGNPVDAHTVYDLLATVIKKMKEDPNFKINKTSTSDQLLEALNWTIAGLAALAVAPTFAQKFIDGMSKAETFISSYVSSPTSRIADGNIIIKRMAGLFFSSATPFMYLSAFSQLGPTLSDSWKALVDSSTAKWRKLIAPIIFGANLLASMSGYNLAKGAMKNLTFIFSDFISSDSKAFPVGNAVATGGVNGKFISTKLLPAPALKPSETANIKTLFEEAANWIGKDILSAEAIASLKAKEQSHGHVTVHVHPLETPTPPSTPVDRQHPVVEFKTVPSAECLNIFEGVDDEHFVSMASSKSFPSLNTLFGDPLRQLSIRRETHFGTEAESKDTLTPHYKPPTLG